MTLTTRLPWLLLVLCSAALAQQAEPDATQQERFDVLEYRVLGSSLLPVADVERAVYGYLGDGKTMADVEAARAALELAYRAAGYATAFVDIPEQDAGEGVIRLRVTEARLDKIRITGARYFLNGQIRAALPALTAGQSPRLPDIQAQLAELNRATPDRTVTPVLKPGQAPGAVDIELKVADTLPVHGSVEVNDRYTADTSRLRINASLGYFNLFQRQHSFTVQYQTAPENPDNLEAIVGTYVLPLTFIDHTSLAIYAVKSNTDVAALGTLSVLGNGKIFGLRALQSLSDGIDLSQGLSYGLEYKDFLEDIQLDADNQLLTPIRYLNWSAAYNATHRSATALTAFNLGLGLGLRGVVNDAGQFADKRYRGVPNYLALRAGLQQTRDLPWWLQLSGRLSGQYSPNALVSNEQFVIGGVDTVRGYLESTQLGDLGANVSLELRHTGLAALLGLAPSAAHVYVFYDGGVVAVQDPLPQQQRDYRIGSVGLGLRVTDWHGLTLGLDLAHGISRDSSAMAAVNRVHFALRYGF